MPLQFIPAAAYIAYRAIQMGYRMHKHRHAGFHKNLNKYGGAAAWGISYAGGTNVGYNVFNEYLTPFMRTNQIRTYTGSPRYITQL